MNTDFDIKTLINYIIREYGLTEEIVLSIIETSILKAASKNKFLTQDIHVEINPKDYKIHIFDKFVIDDELSGVGIISLNDAKRRSGLSDIQEGDIVELEIPMKKLGRICARDTRMMILQKIKNAKNQNIKKEYNDRIGEIVYGVVSGFDRGNIIVTVNGKLDMVIPRTEKIINEKYNIGDKISAVILSINDKQKHSPVVLSRKNIKFVEAILKNEIEEIHNGTVEIIKIARNPGFRSKVSVICKNKNIDVIGLCVGKSGSRIKKIMSELGGEKIDIIKYSDNLDKYIKDALLPVKVIDVILMDNDEVTIVVNTDDYRNVVGKYGNNITLISKLIGHKIHVEKSLDTASFEEKRIHAINKLKDSLDITLVEATTIVNSGYLTIEGIIEEDEENFKATSGLDEIKSAGIYAAAKIIIQCL